MPGAFLLIHRMTTYDSGNPHVVREYAELICKEQDKIIGIYVNRMKKSKHGKYNRWSVVKIARHLNDVLDEKQNIWLTAEEAVDWGVADEVFDGDWEGLILEKK